MTHDAADAFVFFGASGDLAYKKIFPSLYELVRSGRLTVPVVGVAFSHWDLDQLRARARSSIETNGCGRPDPDVLDRLVGLLRYVDGDYADPDTFTSLRRVLGDAQHPLHYLAVPPSVFGLVARQLGASGCATGARVVVEKPFGRDLASALVLNETLHEVFPETSIYRIDHYLGKEETQNLMYFRFANSFVEPMWDRDHVARVVVTLAEDFGVEGRGRFYEEVGCLRDVVQNHALQVVALLAMDAPPGLDAELLRNEKATVFHAMRPMRREDLVRGQFDGYLDEDGVAPDSDVETFVAIRLFIDSWRWEGVPFYVRAGKQLAEHVTEVRVELKAPPEALFPETPPAPGETNYVRFQLNPHVTIAVGARVKTPGEAFVGEQRELVLHDDHPDEMTPYERLLGDALHGEPLLFAREDSVEAAWRVVDPVLREHDAVLPYAPGSWGPAAAEGFVGEDGGWPSPVLD